jgi:hypothetical protein
MDPTNIAESTGATEDNHALLLRHNMGRWLCGTQQWEGNIRRGPEI